MIGKMLLYRHLTKKNGVSERSNRCRRVTFRTHQPRAQTHDGSWEMTLRLLLILASLPGAIATKTIVDLLVIAAGRLVAHLSSIDWGRNNIAIISLKRAVKVP